MLFTIAAFILRLTILFAHCDDAAAILERQVFTPGFRLLIIFSVGHYADHALLTDGFFFAVTFHTTSPSHWFRQVFRHLSSSQPISSADFPSAAAISAGHALSLAFTFDYCLHFSVEFSQILSAFVFRLFHILPSLAMSRCEREQRHARRYVRARGAASRRAARLPAGRR